MAKSSINKSVSLENQRTGNSAGMKNLVLVGALVSATNPYFVWYSAISTAFSRGQKLISDNVFRWIILLLGIFIIVFSIYFVGSGWKMLRT